MISRTTQLLFSLSYLLAFALTISSGLAQADSPASLDLTKYLRKKGRLLKAPEQTTDQDLAQLQQEKFHGVQELLLVNSRITSEGLKWVTHLELDKLYLTGTQVDDSGMRFIAEIRNLTQLSLNDTQITDNGLAKISHLPIVRIYVNNTDISDEAVRYLEGFSLETLYAANTRLTDEGLERLASLPIRALNISGTQISDRSIPILEKMPLYKAYLKGSKISPEQAQRLKLAQVSIDL